MHRGGADRDEACDVVHVDSVASDGDDVFDHSLTGGQQVLVHRADRQRHRNGKAIRTAPAVTERDDARSLGRLAAQPEQRLAQRLVRRVRRVQHSRVFEHARKLGGPKHRRIEL